jgi:DNA-binding IclR family transcriptional regulator
MYWVVNIDQDEMVQVTDMTGHHFPLHAVPTGVALLATMDTSEIDAYLERASSDPAVAVDVDATKSLVERTTRRGVMVCEEELDPGINAFAAAFRGPTGCYDAALYVQGPAFRFPGSNGDRVAELVALAADQLSERFTIY